MGIKKKYQRKVNKRTFIEEKKLTQTDRKSVTISNAMVNHLNWEIGDDLLLFGKQVIEDKFSIVILFNKRQQKFITPDGLRAHMLNIPGLEEKDIETYEDFILREANKIKKKRHTF